MLSDTVSKLVVVVSFMYFKYIKGVQFANKKHDMILHFCLPLCKTGMKVCKNLELTGYRNNVAKNMKTRSLLVFMNLFIPKTLHHR